jgi:hypothetical protein
MILPPAATNRSSSPNEVGSSTCVPKYVVPGARLSISTSCSFCLCCTHKLRHPGYLG